MEIIVFLNFLVPVTIIRRVEFNNKSMRKKYFKGFNYEYAIRKQ